VTLPFASLADFDRPGRRAASKLRVKRWLEPPRHRQLDAGRSDRTAFRRNTRRPGPRGAVARAAATAVWRSAGSAIRFRGAFSLAMSSLKMRRVGGFPTHGSGRPLRCPFGIAVAEADGSDPVSAGRNQSGIRAALTAFFHDREESGRTTCAMSLKKSMPGRPAAVDRSRRPSIKPGCHSIIVGHDHSRVPYARTN